jgi:peptidoglycan/xylan/chitin deacetylase (PgdA/CDA1 family)
VSHIRTIVLILGFLAFVFCLAWGGLKLSGSRRFQLAGELINRVETTDSVVALTFDDGPVPIYTDSVLGILAELDVRATFFMVGGGVEQHPELAAKVRAQGHELGNHSYSHNRLVLKRPSTIRREIESTDSLLRAAGATGEIYVRPPYGKRLLSLPLYLARHDRPVVLWDLEPDTYFTQADDVVRHVMERVRPGSIILLHVEIPSRTQNRLALPEMISQLKARGYRFVTLSELMHAEGSQPSS